jgi:hypothetical protein
MSVDHHLALFGYSSSNSSHSLKRAHTRFAPPVSLALFLIAMKNTPKVPYLSVLVVIPRFRCFEVRKRYLETPTRIELRVENGLLFFLASSYDSLALC